MDSKNQKIALLVDGDNAQAKMMDLILEEASKYGKVTVRRVYGDWTTQHMNHWKNILNEMAFNPIQKFSYTSGKNSTDSALIIDAMDILHDELVQGFCIVSSDSDYTGLAKRLREDGVFVMGIGEQKTPNAFVKSCEIFTYIENLEPKTEKQEKKETEKKHTEKPHIDIRLINKAYDMSINESNEAYISTLGINLRKLDPSFDVRTYGCKTLTQFFSKLKNFVVVDNIVNGLNNPLVKKK
ncbi:MAG TPA: NYN domain-containing protein [Chitinophagaceae bacterium]|nr:NYN domain-containing protein [Chitinophagaceae bacterium]